jgi:succinoglycan biosynthesis protein ExoM
MPKTCILICTCDRPESLRKLLSALVPQANAHRCATVIVDNGINSSEAVVSSFQPEMPIIYERISQPGLVSAKNRAMSLALASHAEFLAFIDDDEVPGVDWLSNLILRVEQTGADFACGPVVPEYATPPARWATEGEFFPAPGDSFRTSNLILRASCLPEGESQWFRHEFNFSGGEDNEFLGRCITAFISFPVPAIFQQSALPQTLTSPSSNSLLRPSDSTHSWISLWGSGQTKKQNYPQDQFYYPIAKGVLQKIFTCQ